MFFWLRMRLIHLSFINTVMNISLITVVPATLAYSSVDGKKILQIKWKILFVIYYQFFYFLYMQELSSMKKVKKD